MLYVWKWPSASHTQLWHPTYEHNTFSTSVHAGHVFSYRDTYTSVNILEEHTASIFSHKDGGITIHKTNNNIFTTMRISNLIL
jgi:hypothetical protein